MAWYWWMILLLGLPILLYINFLFGSIAIAVFIANVEARSITAGYPRMSELAEQRRTESWLDKVPISVIFSLWFMIIPFFVYHFNKTFDKLSKEAEKNNETLDTLRELSKEEFQTLVEDSINLSEKSGLWFLGRHIN